jgi:putative pyruvate formate lyase activating enzyme
MTEEIYSGDEIALLSNCTLCPRECGVNRFEGGTGYCGSDAGMNIASICIHRGEEPAISGPDGICNIFFSGCNLKCIYCQNYEISRPCPEDKIRSLSLNETLDKITGILTQGIKAVGFVSPSHVVPQVKAIINGLNNRGFRPITVYNTNSYDKRETIRSLEGLIDVYLPDYKYVSPEIAQQFSDAFDYPSVALSALKEMFYQKGSVFSIDEMGRAENGILVRHLVLPGHADESISVLSTLANEISTGINISLMSQYHPTRYVRNHPDLKRILYKAEYDAAVEAMEDLGFRNGWVQDMDSYQNYRPDFSKENPFE